MAWHDVAYKCVCMCMHTRIRVLFVICVCNVHSAVGRRDLLTAALCVRSALTRTYSLVPVPVPVPPVPVPAPDRVRDLVLDSGVGRILPEKFRPCPRSYTVLGSRFRDTRYTDYPVVPVLGPVPGSVGPRLGLGRAHRVSRKVAAGFAVGYTVIERVVLGVIDGREDTHPVLTAAAAAAVVAVAVAADYSRTAAVVVDATAVTVVCCDSGSVRDSVVR
jgi:hypothetical protein